MYKYKRYLRVQRLKRQYPKTNEGVNYANVVATLMYPCGLLGDLKRIVFALFFFPTIVIDRKKGSSWMVFYSLEKNGRSDFHKALSILRELLPSPHDYSATHERFSLFGFFRVVWAAFQARKEVTGLLPCGINGLSFLLLVGKFKVVRREMERVLVLGRLRGVITFCDAMPYDNLLAQLARSHGLKSMTYQHGQYRRLDARNMSPDAEAYRNFVSDRMLCWGEATVAEFMRVGIPAFRMVVVGRLYDGGVVSVAARRYRCFGVLLNGENGKFSNANLIATANSLSEKYGYSYFIRPHPANKPKDYLHLVNARFEGVCDGALSGYTEVADFSIAHMTGVIVDLMRAGHRVYVVDDGVLADVFRLPRLSYASLEELGSAITSESSDLALRLKVCRDCYQWFNNDVDQRAVVLGEVS